MVLRVFLNSLEAQVARGALEAAGIQAVIRSDDAGGLHPGMWSARGVRLLVRAEDVAVADLALESFVGPIDVVRPEDPDDQT